MFEIKMQTEARKFLVTDVNYSRQSFSCVAQIFPYYIHVTEKMAIKICGCKSRREGGQYSLIWAI